MSNYSVSQYQRCSWLRVVLMAFIVSVFSLHPVWADDTEIYFNSNISTATKPNLLFVLDASNSMNTYDCLNGSKIAFQKNRTCNDGSPNGENNRLARMVAAMDQVLDNLSDNFNVGLMRFGGFDGGRVIFPITDLSTPGVIDEIKAVIYDLELVTGTPTVGALEETWRYFTGQPVVHGRIRAITNERRSPQSSRVSHPDSYTGGQVVGRSNACDDNLNSTNCADERIIDHPDLGPPIYKSPIVSECQANHAILLTDGGPWVGPGGFDIPYYARTIDTIVDLSKDISEVPDAIVDPNRHKERVYSNGHCKATSKANLCGEELAWYLSENDLSPLPEVQTIVTHAIGFNVQNDWIRNVATAGNGNYIEAESSLELIAAIDTITSSVSDAGVSIIAPAVTIDQFTRLSHREEVYLALFKPLGTANWVGNLKKYKFTGADSKLTDKNGNAAVDANTGEFLPGSQSYWSDSVDGADVLQGGVASKLDVETRPRKMLSYLEIGNKDLTDANNLITDNVTSEMLGVTDAERTDVINWLIGIDVKNEDGNPDTDTRNHIGDPLHSNPVVVTYGVEAGQTLDTNNLNSVVFFGTNEGFLHAIDTRTGEEQFAFMPSELLSNVGVLYADESLGRGEVKPYGMDGDITIRTIDNNNNGFIEASGSDKAYLYAGMRRGGRSYYALDVSEKAAPKLLWSVNGGVGDFVELAQSWSKPTSIQIKIGTEVKDILVFGGGYDPAQDDHAVRTPDSMGRAIYFVDADTGELVWSGGNPEFQPDTTTSHFDFPMEYSMPADVALVADPATGYLAQMYAADMGGQIWRFDINNGSSLDDLVDGDIIAEFAEDDSAEDARRFFGGPDLSLSRADNGALMMNIAIGSGYRAHPLNRTIKDKFFVFRYPYGGHSDNNGERTYAKVGLPDLYDATLNQIADGLSDDDRLQAQRDLAEKAGWYIDMEDSGEKILDSPSTFQGIVRFVSYVPVTSTQPCEPSLGTSFFYAVNLADGTPFEELHKQEPDPQQKRFRRQKIPTPGIAPPISTIFVKSETGTNEEGNEGGKRVKVIPTDVSGTHKLHEWDDVSEPRRWFWAENPD